MAHLAPSSLSPLPGAVASLQPAQTAGAVAPGDRPRGPVTGPSFDFMEMRKYLDGEWFQRKEEIRRFYTDHPEFHVVHGLSMQEQRKRTNMLVHKFLNSPGNELIKIKTSVAEAFAAGEVNLNMFNHNVSVKLGVHCWLSGGSLVYLGTEKHMQKFFRGLSDFSTPCCFAASELGHGSNLRALQTEARYDPATLSFIIDTPSPPATKLWMGGALSSVLAVVFAQLLIPVHREAPVVAPKLEKNWSSAEPIETVERKGEMYENHGVHAFVVPMRSGDANSPLRDGIRVFDCLEKMGLNGVDNGGIEFKNVSIPVDNLLDRYGRVLPNGDYCSPISNGPKRFNTMLSALFFTRLTLTSNGISVMQVALKIAIRYGLQRRAFGPPGGDEVPLMTYWTHRIKLVPNVALAYAAFFTCRYIQERWIGVSDQDRREVEALISGFKSFVFWRATMVTQMCRELCGGQGYLMANMIASLRQDIDVMNTFEGENSLLAQQVGKDLLTAYARDMKRAGRFGGILKFLTAEIQDLILRTDSLWNWLSSQASVRSVDFYLVAVKFREGKLLRSLAKRLRKMVESEGVDAFEAWNRCLEHVQELAEAHIERITVEQFLLAADRAASAEIRAVLSLLCDLHALFLVERHAGWYLQAGFLNSSRTKAVRSAVREIITELMPELPSLVEAWGFPDETIQAPILDGDEGVIRWLKIVPSATSGGHSTSTTPR